MAAACPHYPLVWWRHSEPAIDRGTVQDALAFMMEMDAKLDRILQAVEEDDDGKEADTA
jgi:hypothetical protein